MKSIFTIVVVCLLSIFTGCLNTDQQKSDSGVEKATVKIKTNAEGHTSEQTNIIKRIQKDNEIGAVKHLYVISSYTGDVLEYSTVVGKVTSGGKRLSPKTVIGNSYQTSSPTGNYVKLNGETYATDEVLDDGGTYGESGNYLYWFDAQGEYHQYYPSGGTYLHISERPLRIRKANFSVEVIEAKK